MIVLNFQGGDFSGHGCSFCMIFTGGFSRDWRLGQFLLGKHNALSDET